MKNQENGGMKKNRSTIEPEIASLVTTFNVYGLKTYASCQGHVVWLSNARWPYIAFRSTDTNLVLKLANFLRDDSMDVRPKLWWAWQIEPMFNENFETTYRLTLLGPYRWWTRWCRRRLSQDFDTIEDVAKKEATNAPEIQRV